MKKVYLVLTLIGLAFFFVSCAKQQAPAKQEQAQIWQSQEGTRSFEKMTDDNDQVVGRTSFLGDNYYCLDKQEKRLFFLKQQRADQWNVFMKRLDGGNLSEQRTFVDYIVTDPAISPDGKILAYTDQREKGFNIYTINAEGVSNVRQITNTKEPSFLPSFFPNRRAILYVETGKDNTQYIWSVNLDNTTPTQHCVGYSPSFFADGKKIAFVRNNLATKQSELYVYDFENSKEFLLLSDPDRSFYQPSVSPSGKYVAYTAKTAVGRTEKNFDIYMIDLQGKQPIQVTFYPGNDINPKWSQDGKYLYILSQRNSSQKNYNIWRVKAF